MDFGNVGSKFQCEAVMISPIQVESCGIPFQRPKETKKIRAFARLARYRHVAQVDYMSIELIFLEKNVNKQLTFSPPSLDKQTNCGCGRF